MPASRDTDWTHVRVVGKREDAQPYVSYGRKLLGYVKQDAGFNGLGTNKVQKVLPDGTLVIAEMHGKMPRITIVTSKVSGDRMQHPDRFVTWARDDSQPTGIDATYPEQWLDVPAVTLPEDADWLTRFHDASVAGYEAFAGDKGAYATLKGRKAFQQGTRKAGNLDHRNLKGERVSWYGPSSRMFHDAFVMHLAVYGGKVYSLGQVMLDLELEGDGMTMVLGAGMHGGYLYVVQTIPYAKAFYDGIPTDGDWASSPAGILLDAGLWTNQIRIYKYRVARKTSAPGADTIKASYASQTLVWTASSKMELQPWFFSPDCSQAVHSGGHAFEGGAWIKSRITLSAIGDDGTYFPEYSPGVGLPAEYDDLTTVNTQTGAATVVATSIPAGDGRAILSRDFNEAGEMVSLDVVRQGAILSVAMGATSWPIHTQTAAKTIEHRGILFVDVREQVIVFCVRHERWAVYTHMGSDVFGVVEGNKRIEIWRKGMMLYTETFPDALKTPATTNIGNFNIWLHDSRLGASYFTILNTLAIAPSMAIYGQAQYRIGDNTDPSKYTGVADQPYGLIKTEFGANTSFLYAGWIDYIWYFWEMVYAGTITRKGPDVVNLYPYDLDSEGHYTPLHCATLGTFTALTCRKPVGTDEKAGFNWINDATLAALTGVNGAHVRYRPLWCLGTFTTTIPL